MYRAVRIVGLLVVCIIASAQTLPANANTKVTSPVLLAQRLVAISKSSCPTAAQAQLKAEKKNPGWKVTNIKELSKVWHITMKR